MVKLGDREPLVAEMLIKAECIVYVMIVHYFETEAVHQADIPSVQKEETPQCNVIPSVIDPDDIKNRKYEFRKIMNRFNSNSPLKESYCFDKNKGTCKKPDLVLREIGKVFFGTNMHVIITNQ